MGEASNRGSLEERIQAAQVQRAIDNAEIIICLQGEGGEVHATFMPRDETPNQDSPAVIMAGYLNANFNQLASEAMALYMSHHAAQRGELPMNGTIAEAPKRSIITPDGNIARRTDDVELILPAGYPPVMNNDPAPMVAGGGGDFGGGGAEASFEAPANDPSPASDSGSSDSSGGGE